MNVPILHQKFNHLLQVIDTSFAGAWTCLIVICSRNNREHAWMFILGSLWAGGSGELWKMGLPMAEVKGGFIGGLLCCWILALYAFLSVLASIFSFRSSIRSDYGQGFFFCFSCCLSLFIFSISAIALNKLMRILLAVVLFSEAPRVYLKKVAFRIAFKKPF